jgi:NADPH:quinone reductase-like Zn-dependent oxidoreductase
MRSLGADAVGDHQREDFSDFAPFDRILDLVATRSPFACRRALAPGGRYRCVGGAVRTLLPIVTVGPVLGRATGRRVGMLAVKQGPDHFEPLAQRCLDGEVTIHIDRTFGLDDVPEALAYVGEGRALGKVVVAPG